MTKKEAREQLAENLMLLAEALLEDETAGEFRTDGVSGELKITSVLGNSTTVVAIKNWRYDELEDDDEWSEVIY